MAIKTQQKKAKPMARSTQTRNSPAAQNPPSSGAKDKTALKQKAAAELAAELKNLRAEIKEPMKHVSLRIDSGIVGTLHVLEKKQTPGALCSLPGVKTSAQMTKKLRALKIKPGKGRLKDIAQVEQIVEKITNKTLKKQ